MMNDKHPLVKDMVELERRSLNSLDREDQKDWVKELVKLPEMSNPKKFKFKLIG